MKNKNESINAVANTVIEILSAPEFSCMPRYNREDVIGVVSVEIIELLSKFGVKVNPIEAADVISRAYRERVGIKTSSSVLIGSGNATH